MPSPYFTSERFIHDELRRRAGQAVDHLQELWKDQQRIDPILLLWPAEPVRTKEGVMFEGCVYCELTGDEQARRATMLQAIERVRPYGLLLVEQREGAVKAIFETHHGTRTWTLPIKKHGDVRVLYDPQSADDAESLGFLWKRGVAKA